MSEQRTLKSKSVPFGSCSGAGPRVRTCTLYIGVDEITIDQTLCFTYCLCVRANGA